jgi:hypothetical protein
VARLQIILTQCREHIPLVTAQNPFRPKTAWGIRIGSGLSAFGGIVLQKSFEHLGAKD